MTGKPEIAYFPGAMLPKCNRGSLTAVGMTTQFLGRGWMTANSETTSLRD